MKKNYESPLVEILEVNVEHGYAASEDYVSPSGGTDAFEDIQGEW